MSRFDDAFERLLAAWRHHQDLRAAGASIADLYASRARLDEARTFAALGRLGS